MHERPQDAPSSVELALIRNALEQAHGDKALAVRLLGISRTELRRRMEQQGLTTEDWPEE
jgi:DNA-binding NtrC family response regulator